MSFAFHFEVAIGVGKPDDAATADAEPNQAITAQRVNSAREYIERTAVHATDGQYGYGQVC